MIKAHAKVNLSLFVTGLRDDGFHEIRSIFVKIGLFDTIFLSPSYVQKITASAGPQGKDNLVARVLEDRPYEVFIKKIIPIGSGLGGGSSDAAQLIKHFFNNTSVAFQKALSIGSDVPFFLIDENAALVSGRGENLEPFNIEKPLYFVVYYPGFSFDTKEGYLKLAEKRLYIDEKEAENRIRLIKDILLSGEYGELRDLLFNSFELIHAESFIKEFKDLMLKEGAIGALMTGSGSAVFGIFDRFPTELYTKYHDRFIFTTNLM